MLKPKILALTTLVLVSLVVLAACGGGGIPDDVEWTVVGTMEPAPFGGGNYRVRLNKPVSEDVLRAIGKEVKKQHGDKYLFTDSPTGRYRSNHATVRTWFYLPGMDTDNAAWGQARFDPDEETIEIWGNLQQ